MKTTNRFPKIIGQDIAKRKLDFHLDNFEASRVIPHLLFIAPKGCGKTTLAKAAGQNLINEETGKPKTFLEINCSTLKNVSQFINQVVVPHINRQDVTVLFDEASDSIDQGLRFPTSSTGNHQKWPVKRKDDFKLRSIQRRFIVNTRGGMRGRI